MLAIVSISIVVSAIVWMVSIISNNEVMSGLQARDNPGREDGRGGTDRE